MRARVLLCLLIACSVKAQTEPTPQTIFAAALSNIVEIVAPVDATASRTFTTHLRFNKANGVPDRFADSTVEISPSDRARRVHEIISACEKAGIVGAGFHQAQGTASGSATRNGNFRYDRTSLAGLTVTARTKEGDASGFFQRSHWDIGKLDTERVASEAVRKALEDRT